MNSPKRKRGGPRRPCVLGTCLPAVPECVDCVRRSKGRRASLKSRDKDPERHRRLQREWRHTEKGRNYGRQFRGVKDAQHMAPKLKAYQFNLCAICLSSAPTCLDHDHSTGLARGLLCTPCNTGLGMFRDNPVFMQLAAAYIVETPAQRVKETVWESSKMRSPLWLGFLA